MDEQTNPEAAPEVVTQEVLDANPVLAENGVEVGAPITEATPEQVAEGEAKAAEEVAG